MAKYQKYAEYKDSGVEWFVELPIDWKVSKLKQVVDQNRQITYGIVQAGPNVENGIPYIRPADMTDEKGIKSFDELLRTSEQIALSYDRSKIKTGDIVISIGPSFGKVMMTPANLDGANLTQGTARIAISSEHNSRYFFWVLRSTISFSQWESVIGGATFRALNLGPLADTYVGFPSYDEQVKIATFLDHETAKIDSLIAKQEKLIELLKEKRQAVISHAVTKGLNPDVAMKDSGVEWLGQVPEHWEISPIKFILENKDYKRIPLSAEERGNFSGDYRYYGASGVIDYIDDYIFDEPNVLVGEDGANLVNRNTPLAFPAYGKYWVNNHAHILHPQDGLADYWAELIEIIDISPLVSGSAQPKLTAEALKNLKISFPSDMEERKAIDAFIKQQKAKFDLLISKATDQIKLLKERRTALISSAVTGKIDVHNWQHPNEAKTEFSA